MKTKKFFYLLPVLITLFFLTTISFAQSPNWMWTNGFGGINGDRAFSVANDAYGNVYTTGDFFGTVDFDPDTSVTFNLTSVGGYSAFISKLDSLGHFVWAISMSGASLGRSVAVDASGYVYVTGEFTFNTSIGPFTLFPLGSSTNMFICKLDNSGQVLWAKSQCGIGNDKSYAIAVDHSGSVYTTGDFPNTVDFDPGPGVYGLTAASTLYWNSFVSKLDSLGNFVWAKELGGAGASEGNSIALDDSGNVYTTGDFFGTSSDFDPGPGVFNLTGSGAYISKLDSSGNFVWAKVIGAIDGIGNAIALDASGSIYTTGQFSGTSDFDPGPGTFNLTSLGNSDIFISKLDHSGNFVWAKAMGDSSADEGTSIALDGFGNVYTTGTFMNTVDFDPNAGTFNLSSRGGSDIFISKLDSSGNFVWAKTIGGGGNEYGHSIAVNDDNINVAGEFFSWFMMFDSDTLVNAGSGLTQNMFVAKLAYCSANFTVYADTVPHNWLVLNQATGSPPLTYSWDWGDGNTSPGAAPSHTYSIPAYYNICLTINDAAGCTSTFCDSSTYLFRGNNNNTMITIDVLPLVTVGVNELNATNSFVRTLPNPFSNEITIKGTNAKGEVVLYDVSGRIILRKKTMNDETKIGTEFISHGFYLLQYIEENKSTNFKLTKF